MNDFIFNNVFLSPSSVIQSDKLDLEDFLLAHHPDSPTPVSLQHTRISTKWIPPPIGNLKLNWDAALNSSVNKMRIGLINKYHSGPIIASLSSSRSFNSLLVLAECIALQRGLLICDELGCTDVSLEGDAL